MPHNYKLRTVFGADRAPAPPDCPSPSMTAYAGHINRGEIPCAACRECKAAATLRSYHTRKVLGPDRAPAPPDCPIPSRAQYGRRRRRGEIPCAACAAVHAAAMLARCHANKTSARGRQPSKRRRAAEPPAALPAAGILAIDGEDASRRLQAAGAAHRPQLPEVHGR